MVIVPGGGVFADQVRHAQQQWQFDDVAAHQMAILAMQQMALLFNGLKPSFKIANSIAEIQLHLVAHHRIIWSPAIAELNNAGIAASWGVTSDSLSAWLAQVLLTDELVLVKSAQIPKDYSLQELAQLAVLDSAFCNFVRNVTYKISVVNYQQFSA
jgi:aspartokinase-like uncharacterized kinase